MKFVGCEADKIDRIVVVGLTGESSGPHHSTPELIRQSSHRLGSYSLRLDGDLSALAVCDAGDHLLGSSWPDDFWKSEIRRGVLSGRHDANEEFLKPLLDLYPDLHCLHLSAGLEKSVDWGRTLGKGRLWHLGGRQYSKEQRDEMRSTQRLLPLVEVDLEVAARSAQAESGNAPLFVSLHLDVLEPHLVPDLEVVRWCLFGADHQTVRQALDAVDGSRVVAFEVVAPVKENATFSLSALTAAQYLRDNILTWWNRRL